MTNIHKTCRDFEQTIMKLYRANDKEFNNSINFIEDIVKYNEDFLVDFIEFLYKRRQKQYKTFDDSRVNKLINNINLLVKYIYNNNVKTTNELKDLLKQIKIELVRINMLIIETDDTYSEAYDDAKKSAKRYISRYVKKKIKEQESKVTNITTQIITILSIFTAVVITFFGGISFINSSLSILSKTSIDFLLIIIGIEGAVLFNLLYLLFVFICKIIDKDLNQSYIWKFTNIFLCILICIGIIYTNLKIPI